LIDSFTATLRRRHTGARRCSRQTLLRQRSSDVAAMPWMDSGGGDKTKVLALLEDDRAHNATCLWPSNDIGAPAYVVWCYRKSETGGGGKLSNVPRLPAVLIRKVALNSIGLQLINSTTSIHAPSFSIALKQGVAKLAGASQGKESSFLCFLRVVLLLRLTLTLASTAPLPGLPPNT
jgi:hypothetical protein